MIKRQLIGIADEKLFEQLEISGFGDFPTISTRYPQIRQTTEMQQIALNRDDEHRDFVRLPTMSIFVA